MVKIQGPGDSQQPQEVESQDKPTQVPSAGGVLGNITSAFTSIDLSSVWNLLTNLVSISSYKELENKRNELVQSLEEYLPANTTKQDQNYFNDFLKSHLTILNMSQLETIKNNVNNPATMQAFQMVINLYRDEPKELARELGAVLNSILDGSINKRVEVLNKMVNSTFPISDSSNLKHVKPLWEATATNLAALENRLNEEMSNNRHYPLEHADSILKLLNSETGKNDLKKFYSAIYSAQNLLKATFPKLTTDQFVQITNYLWDKALHSPNDDIFNVYLENVLTAKDPFSLGSTAMPDELNAQIDQAQKEMLEEINKNSDIPIQERNQYSSDIMNIINEFKIFLKKDALHIELLNNLIKLIKNKESKQEIDSAFHQFSQVLSMAGDPTQVEMFKAVATKILATTLG